MITELQAKSAKPKDRPYMILDDRGLMRTIREYPYPIMRAAMLFSVLIFARPGEVRAAEWAEIDTERVEWRIPAEKMKMRRPHIVPLATKALAGWRNCAAHGVGTLALSQPRNDVPYLCSTGYVFTSSHVSYLLHICIILGNKAHVPYYLKLCDCDKSGKYA